VGAAEESGTSPTALLGRGADRLRLLPTAPTSLLVKMRDARLVSASLKKEAEGVAKREGSQLLEETEAVGG